LVITPEQRRQLRPLVAAIVERAPDISGWEFYAYRQPGDVGDATATVAGRAGGDLTGAMVRAQRGEHNRIDLCFYTPRATHRHDRRWIRSTSD